MKPRSLESWIEQQKTISARRMEQAISATHLCRLRDIFGQQAIPAQGSVLASPVVASWDPEPDYFFHWLRDSAIVMDAVITLSRNAASPEERNRWNWHFDDFVRFSLALSQIDGADFLNRANYRQATKPEAQKFLRPDSELAALRGDKLLGEPRFNPDGTPDFCGWSRPQYDGPALRALTCLRYDRLCREQSRTPPEGLARLIRQDLDFTMRYADALCIGPWEEENEIDNHYYVAVAQLGALHHGGQWARQQGDHKAASQYQATVSKVRQALDGNWSYTLQVYKALRGKTGTNPGDVVDACTILAPLDAALPEGRHSLMDERVQATVAAINKMFDAEFPVNRSLGRNRAPALGRSRDDHYFGGGAWYPTTLGAATFYYRLAAMVAERDQCLSLKKENTDFRKAIKGKTPDQQARSLIRRGDAVMRTVRQFTPADGSLSEQFDRATGRQTSARHLTWSYAAFITAAFERKSALARFSSLPPSGNTAPAP